MNRVPRFLTALLHAIGVEPAVIGDLDEITSEGRSRLWCWRQVAGILLLGSAPPLVIVWPTWLLLFALFHMTVVIPWWIVARQTGQWTLASGAALAGGYSGFAALAWFATRVHRRAAAAIGQFAKLLLVGIVVAVILGLFGSAWTVAAAAAAATQTVAWTDSSTHRTTLVSVDQDVRLEVLDWGGSGQALLLLAGLGDTAHVFDDVAPTLAKRYRVVGVTRRGHPQSSAPATGYSTNRLAEDLVRVMDAAHLTRPVVVGHSFAGEEMHVLGARHAARIAALVYVDAAFNRADAFQEYESLLKTLPPPPRPTAGDLASYEALRGFLTRTQGPPGPEARLRARYIANADGTIRGPWAPEPHVLQAYSSLMKSMTTAYSPERIRVPALAVYAAPKSAGELMRSWYSADDAAMSQLVAKLYPLDRENVARHEKWFTGFADGGVVSELSGGHDLMVTNPHEVLKQIDAFVASLPITG